jgi:hypothetical protein
MASILKVDQLQKPDGSTPTAADLGLNVAGSIVNRVTQEVAIQNVTSTSYVDVATITYTPKAIGNLLVLEWRGVLSQNNSGSAGGIMQWTKDGVGIAVPANGGELVIYTSSAFDQYHAGTFYKETIATASSHTFKLQAKAMGSISNGLQLGGGWSINHVTITEIAQ